MTMMCGQPVPGRMAVRRRVKEQMTWSPSFVGTGIGGSAVIGGRMLGGCSNTLGEIRHVPVDLNGPKCHCGSWGCVEAIAGGSPIALQAREAVDSSPREGEVLLRLSGGRAEAITAGMG